MNETTTTPGGDSGITNAPANSDFGGFNPADLALMSAALTAKGIPHAMPADTPTPNSAAASPTVTPAAPAVPVDPMAAAMQPPPTPSGYELPPVNRGEQITPELQAYREQSQQALHSFGFNPGTGKLVAQRIDEAIQQPELTDLEAATRWSDTQRTLQRQWGAEYDTRIAAIQKAVQATTAKHPGVADQIHRAERNLDAAFFNHLWATVQSQLKE